MGDLIRRNKPTTVQARRVEGDPTVIDVPGAVPVAPAGHGGAPPPPQPANVTQNIFYISAPAETPEPAPTAASPAPPQEVHYHTTVHHAPRASGRRRGLSFFGSAAVVLGGLGCAANFLPQAEVFAKPLAMAGLTAAGLGLLGAILLGRAGKGMPVLGLLVSGAALGLWLHKHDPQVRAKIDQIQKGIPPVEIDGLPGIGGKKPPSPASAKPAVPPAPEAPPKKDTSVFNFNRSAPVAAPTSSAPRPVVGTAATNLALAQDKLEKARIEAARGMSLDYTAAKKNAEQAAAELEKARATLVSGSPELTAANQRKMDTDAALGAILNRLYRDGDVAAAEESLKAAKKAYAR